MPPTASARGGGGRRGMSTCSSMATATAWRSTCGAGRAPPPAEGRRSPRTVSQGRERGDCSPPETLSEPGQHAVHLPVVIHFRRRDPEEATTQHPAEWKLTGQTTRVSNCPQDAVPDVLLGFIGASPTMADGIDPQHVHLTPGRLVRRGIRRGLDSGQRGRPRRGEGQSKGLRQVASRALTRSTRGGQLARGVTA